MWQLNLDCHEKPRKANECTTGEGVVPDRQRQRLPLLRLHVRLHPIQCSVPNLRSVAHDRPVQRQTKNANFPAPTHNPLILHLKPSLETLELPEKFGDNHSSRSRVISEQTNIHRPT